MRRFITTTLAAILAAGTITVAHPACAKYAVTRLSSLPASSQSQSGVLKDEKSKRKNNPSDGLDNGDSLRKKTVNKINDIEKEMLDKTADVRTVIDKKRAEFSEYIKSAAFSDEEIKKLKKEFLAENALLMSKLESMQRPFLKRIRTAQKEYLKMMDYI